MYEAKLNKYVTECECYQANYKYVALYQVMNVFVCFLFLDLVGLLQYNNKKLNNLKYTVINFWSILCHNESCENTTKFSKKLVIVMQGKKVAMSWNYRIVKN